jgi:cytochrome c-type biogenesis protein CcmE
MAMDQDTKQAPDADDGMTVPARRRRRGDDGVEMSPTRRRALVIGLVAGGAAICGLVLLGLQGGSIYKPVDELLANVAKFGKVPELRVEGTLVHGSLAHPTPCEHLFTIEKNGATLPVHIANKCALPDNFVDRSDMPVAVTVAGKLLADNSFEATDVLTKCPTKYEMQERAQNGVQMPHAAPQKTY